MPTAGPEATRFLSQYSVLTQLHNCIVLYYALRISQIRVAVVWPNYFTVGVQKRHETSRQVVFITLVDLQIDAQNSSLHIIHKIKSSTCFEHYPAHLQKVYVVIVYMQPLSCAPVHKTVTCREWRYQRLHTYSYDVDLLKTSRAMLGTCRGF